MKTPAIISALTVVGSIAFAAGQSQTVRVISVDEKPMEGDEPPVMAMGAGSCEPYPEEVWFQPTLRVIQGCPTSGTGLFQGDPAAFTAFRDDVNADGTLDYFFPALPSTSTSVVSNGQPLTGTLIAHCRIREIGGAALEFPVCVLRKETVATLLLEQFPGLGNASLRFGRWQDMDGDGDLDIVFRVGGVVGDVWRWLENIGYEKPDPPVAADLNQDGAVNGEDLGMLLAAWTIP
jgi:hypothetical protein